MKLDHVVRRAEMIMTLGLKIYRSMLEKISEIANFFTLFCLLTLFHYDARNEIAEQ